MAKSYEIMTISKVDLGETGAKKQVDQVKELITALGGKITKEASWGKRKFAYKIKGDEEGYYDVLNFEMEGDSVEKLKPKLNLVDNLVRYLISVMD